MKKHKLDDLLNATKANAPKPGQKCRCCHNAEVRAILDRYYERIDDGEALPSLAWIYQQLIAEHGMSFGAVRNHVVNHLKRNPSTGELRR